MQYPGDYVTIVKKPSNRYDQGLFEIRGIPNTFFEFSYLGDRGFIEIKESGTAIYCVNRNVKEGLYRLGYRHTHLTLLFINYKPHILV